MAAGVNLSLGHMAGQCRFDDGWHVSPTRLADVPQTLHDVKECHDKTRNHHCHRRNLRLAIRHRGRSRNARPPAIRWTQARSVRTFETAARLSDVPRARPACRRTAGDALAYSLLTAATALFTARHAAVQPAVCTYSRYPASASSARSLRWADCALWRAGGVAYRRRASPKIIPSILSIHANSDMICQIKKSEGRRTDTCPTAKT